MIPIETHQSFHAAYKSYFNLIGNNPDIKIGLIPMDASNLSMEYVILQEGDYLYCEYRRFDRQYNGLEMKRLLKKINKPLSKKHQESLAKLTDPKEFESWFNLIDEHI